MQNLQGLTGTALVAGSPIRHDNTVQGNPVEVQTYQPPWKTLSDFALQSDLDQPAFQQLVGCSHTWFYSIRADNNLLVERKGGRLVELYSYCFIFCQSDSCMCCIVSCRSVDVLLGSAGVCWGLMGSDGIYCLVISSDRPVRFWKCRKKIYIYRNALTSYSQTRPELSEHYGMAR